MHNWALLNQKNKNIFKNYHRRIKIQKFHILDLIKTKIERFSDMIQNVLNVLILIERQTYPFEVFDEVDDKLDVLDVEKFRCRWCCCCWCCCCWYCCCWYCCGCRCCCWYCCCCSCCGCGCRCCCDEKRPPELVNIPPTDEGCWTQEFEFVVNEPLLLFLFLPKCIVYTVSYPVNNNVKICVLEETKYNTFFQKISSNSTILSSTVTALMSNCYSSKFTFQQQHDLCFVFLNQFSCILRCCFDVYVFFFFSGLICFFLFKSFFLFPNITLLLSLSLLLPHSLLDIYIIPICWVRKEKQFRHVMFFTHEQISFIYTVCVW